MKKLFTWDYPAQGFVFSLALLLFGSWSVWSLFILCGGLSPVIMGLIACGFGWVWWLLTACLVWLNWFGICSFFTVGVKLLFNRSKKE